MTAMKTLFVTDLDGTLLTSGITLSDYSVSGLNRLIRSGALITYSTARSFYTASMLLKDVSFRLPCIIYNGVFVVDASTKRTIKRNLLNNEIYHELLRLSAPLNLKPFVFGNTFRGDEVLLYGNPDNSAQASFIRERINRNDKRLRYRKNISGPPCELISLNYVYPDDRLEEFERQARITLADAVSIKHTKDIYNDGFANLEFSHPAADKGIMLQYIAELLDIDLKHITVFGDQMNDSSMFSISGTSVAVENADPRLKELADHVTFSNNQNGVVRYIESVFQPY